MRDVQTTILGIESSPTRTGGTMFKFKLGNGEEVSTFDVATATKASQSNGQPVTLRIESVQKGNRTYHNLKDIALAGETLAAQIPAPGTPIGALPITPAQPSTNGNGKGGFSEADKVRITKLAALSTAYGFVGHLIEASGLEYADATNLADELAKKLYNDARSHEGGSVTPSSPVQVGTNGVTPAAEPAALPWSVA